MARTIVVSETHTIHEHSGKGLVFNATKIEIPSTGLRLSVTADRSDSNWDTLNIQGRADDFRKVIRRAAQARQWRIFIPEVSARAVIIGFHDKIEVDELIAFSEEIGFTQKPPSVKRAPKKRARG